MAALTFYNRNTNDAEVIEVPDVFVQLPKNHGVDKRKE
jgi:hypothetical protein